MNVNVTHGTRRRRRVASASVAVLALLVAAQPLTAFARTTRLRPMAPSAPKTERAAETPSAAAQAAAPAADVPALDSRVAAIMLDLYKQMVAGAPFSEEETVILNRYAADQGVTELEADVVVSRALYAQYVSHAALTKRQQDLLDRYTAEVARRTRDIADLKAQMSADRANAAKTAGTRAPQAPPANDTCAGAEVIPAAGPFPYLTSVTADITDATTTGDPGVPSCQSNVSRSIWYTFTPTTTATYTISACADAPTATTVDDTVIALFTSTGGCAGPFTQLTGGCDDDSCATENLQSVVTSMLTSGTTYYVVVWQFDQPAPTVGNTAVQLRVTQAVPPANDTCAGAVALTLNTPVTGALSALATNDYQLSGSACFTGIGQTSSTAVGRDVVYTFTAPSAGNYDFKVTNFGASNLVLYVASSCPVGAPPQTVTSCLAASNRNTTTANGSEEVYNLALTSGQLVYVFVDENAATAGGNFRIEVNATTTETEPNDTPATAGALSCGVEGSITPAGEADFFTLGTPTAGSRVFALVDGSASGATGGGSANDFDLRVTTATDTLEYDDAGNDTLFGSLSANVGGTPLTGVASYLRVSHFTAAATAEPYRLYAVVQPPSASATAEVEPNETIGAATSAANNYFSGTLAGPAPSTDMDVYSTGATAGDLIVVGLDGDPTRDNTPINAKLELLNSAGAVLVTVNDGGSTSSITTGAGSLTSGTPNSPAEGLTYRVTTTDTYYVRVTIGTTSTTSTGAGDYLLSISKNCAVGGGGGNCVLTCPGNVTVGNTTGTCGAVVNYSAPTTTGNCGTVTCVPAAGSTFAVGTTTVTCTSSNGPTCSFTVTVNDTQAPTLTCPSNITTGASSGMCGAAVTYTTPTANDNCSGATVQCSPASGTTFPIGVTTVSCTATDASNNSAACTFTVTVNDTQAPTVACPSNATVPATGPGGATYTYTTPTASDNCPGATVVCAPSSGSTFPVGTTTVTCTATDASSNTGTCSFTVTVTPAVTGGTDTVGVYVPATNGWFLRNSNTTGPADVSFGYGGASTLVAIKGDWDGDGDDTAGLYDPATGTFYLKNTNAGGAADITFGFGAGGAGNIPISGDWNNDGVDSVGFYNPATGVFFLKNTNAAGGADFTFMFGGAGAGLQPIAGDWNNDGTDSVGLYNPTTGVFFLKNANAAGGADFVFTFGAPNAGFVAIAGDWNGDGTDSVGLYLPSNGAFFLTNSSPSGSADYTFVYGPPNLKPLGGDWDGL